MQRAELWRAMKPIVRLLVSFLLFVAPARADVFDWLRGDVDVAGTVGYVQANHFMLVAPNNQMLRIFLEPGMMMPPGIMPGQYVFLKIHEGDDKLLYLSQMQAIQQPNGTLVPPAYSPGVVP